MIKQTLILKTLCELNAGCYRFNVLDSDDDGISQANNDGGGYARLKKVAGGNFYMIEEDFGKYISQAFRFGTDLISGVEEVDAVVEESEKALVVFPNPTNSSVKLRLENWVGEVSWELRNSMGSLIRSGEFLAGEGYLLNVEMEDLSRGVYSISVENEEEKAMKWVVKK